MTELIKEIFMQHIFSSLKAAAVTILLFALTKPITKRYTAGFRYYSWLVVMIIFLIPFAQLGIGYKVSLPAFVKEIYDIRGWRGEETQSYPTSEERAAIAIVMLVTAMISFCAAAANGGYFSEIFEGDVSYLADFVTTEKKSASDENYTLTLEQYLVAQGQAAFINEYESLVIPAQLYSA